MRHISPPRLLKTVELRISRARQRGIPEQVVSWLFVPSLLKAEQPQAISFTVENAVIALGDRAACLLDGETPETQQTLSAMWASLRTLDCNFSSLNRVHQAILLCTGLRQLTIGAEVFWKLAEVHLPKHLEHLVLICYDVDFISVHDKAASDLLNQASATSGPSAVMRSLRKLDFLVDANLIGDNTLRAVPHLAQNNGETYYRIGNFECMTMTSIACYSRWY